MKYRCSLCGHIYHNTVFKGGYVCEDCLNYIKSLNLSAEKADEGVSRPKTSYSKYRINTDV